MSLRLTAYIASQMPRGGPKMQNVCQRQSCKSFIGLSIGAKMVGGDIPFYLNIWLKLTHPIQKR